MEVMIYGADAELDDRVGLLGRLDKLELTTFGPAFGNTRGDNTPKERIAALKAAYE
jgi:hypothetical protein